MLRSIAGLAIAAVALSACGGSSAPTLPATTTGAASNESVDALQRAFSCYPETGPRSMVSATVTFYGWPDNTPPGRAIAHPVIHNFAAGDGTYCNPTTFATEPTKTENALFPYGTRLYVVFLHQYFIREDDCTPSGPPVGNGNNGCYKIWFDLWVGGTKESNTNAVVNCENALTPNGQSIVWVNPPPDLPVEHPGSLYNNDPPPAGTCFGMPGSTANPNQAKT
jgi:hypothetical protein